MGKVTTKSEDMVMVSEKELAQLKSKEEIRISMQEYRRLLGAERMLEALEGAGVDNWQGYDTAMEIYNGER